MSGWIFLGWTSTCVLLKDTMQCRRWGSNTQPLGLLHPWATALPCCDWHLIPYNNIAFGNIFQNCPKLLSFISLSTSVVGLITFANSWNRSGPTICQAWSGSKLFDTLMVFLKEFVRKKWLKNQQTIKKHATLPSRQRFYWEWIRRNSASTGNPWNRTSWFLKQPDQTQIWDILDPVTKCLGSDMREWIVLKI